MLGIHVLFRARTKKGESQAKVEAYVIPGPCSGAVIQRWELQELTSVVSTSQLRSARPVKRQGGNSTVKQDYSGSTGEKHAATLSSVTTLPFRQFLVDMSHG